jgi:hypothetical protein
MEVIKMKKAIFTLLLMTAVALAFVSGASNKVIQAVSDKIDEGDYYVTQFNSFVDPNQQQRNESRPAPSGPTAFSTARSGGSRSSESKYRPFNTEMPRSTREYWKAALDMKTDKFSISPSERDIDRAIASYEEALKLLPSGTWKPNRSTTLPPEGGIQARLENAKRIKQQWMAEKQQKEQQVARVLSTNISIREFNAGITKEDANFIYSTVNGQNYAVDKATRSNYQVWANSAWQTANVGTAAERQEQQQQEAQQRVDEAPNTTPNSPEDFDVMQNTDGGITITNYKGTRKHVVIPDTLYGLKVTRIGGEAFFRKGLISVVIPNTVITIGDATNWGWVGEENGAFCYNNLVKVTLGNSLRTIGIQAFYGNPLTEITIPNSVVEIDQSAFENCRLTRITWGNRITAINAKAFKNNMLESVVIPNGITVISAGLFENNRLTSIIIPNSVTSIYGFRGNPLTRITLPANINPNNIEGLDSDLINYYISQGLRAGTYVRNGPVWVRQ